MIPFGLASLMTVSLPIGRRATKCLVPGASAIYLCNEGSGTVIRDYSGNARDAAFGAAGAAPSWGATGVYFDGGDYASCAAAWLDAPTALTVIVVATLANTDTERLINRATGVTTTGAGWILSKDATGAKMIMYDGAGNRAVSTAAVPATGAPVFLAGVWDGATVTAYTGLTAATATACVGHTAATAQDLTLGKASWSNDGPLTGTIHAALVYPFAFTPAQLAATKAALAAFLATRGATLA